jgi:hypothetical protein
MHLLSDTDASLHPWCRSNIVEAHGQIAALIEQEYSDEDKAIIQLESVEVLQHKLDAVIGL